MKTKPRTEELAIIAAMIHGSFVLGNPETIAQAALALWQACHKLADES